MRQRKVSWPVIPRRAFPRTLSTAPHIRAAPGHRQQTSRRTRHRGDNAATLCRTEVEDLLQPHQTALQISSLTTEKPVSFAWPKLVVIATSTASRPVAIKILPMRGRLWRASNVHQQSPSQASNQALKTI